MKLDALEHPKTLDLASQLGVSRPTVLGHLELLWAFTGKHSPQGDIGKWPDGAIARACEWMGDPKSFLQSLLQSGFIDAHPEHRYVIHDWHEHAPRWVRAKLAKAELKFVPPVAASDGSHEEHEATVSATTVATTEPSSKGSEAKCSEAKRSAETRTAPLASANGKQPTPEGAMAIALRDLGVVVRSIDPVLTAWIRDGYTTQQAVDAVGIARIRKPHPEAIPANYLDKILREPARAPPPKAAGSVTWRPTDDDGANGCTPPNSTTSNKH